MSIPTPGPSAPTLNPEYGPNHLVLAPPRSMSITSMVLALVSILFDFTLVLPSLSLIFGAIGLRKEPAGRGMALTGVIISGVILAAWVLLHCFLLSSVIYALAHLSFPAPGN